MTKREEMGDDDEEGRDGGRWQSRKRMTKLEDDNRAVGREQNRGTKTKQMGRLERGQGCGMSGTKTGYGDNSTYSTKTRWQ